jgi:hypothetical protein
MLISKVIKIIPRLRQTSVLSVETLAETHQNLYGDAEPRQNPVVSPPGHPTRSMLGNQAKVD